MKSSEYMAWLNIRQKCNNRNCPVFDRYGGRGISIHPAWDSFATFFADVGPKPSAGHELTRIDHDGNFEPGNVHWADPACIDGMYEPVTESGCWLWTEHSSPRGYGVIQVGRKKWFAHRLSWTRANGDIPAGLHVCHKCDTPACINPAHLFLGTDADNAADRMRKGRFRTRPRTNRNISEVRHDR